MISTQRTRAIRDMTNVRVVADGIVSFTCLVLLILSASFAFAQKQTAAIEGTVEDGEGRPIPGVTVIASSPSLIGGRTIAFTDNTGYYRFPAISSGVYSVQAQLNGFQTIIRNDVRLFVGITLDVSFTLQMTQLSEQVEVIGRPPLIDASTTAVSVTVPPEIIQNLPKRNIEELLMYTPGVSDDLIAYGGDGQKANAYWIDGVNLADPRSGIMSVKYDYNWIDQLQVTGIGAPAEYGGFTGVLANYTTRSGSNQFHGLFETFFQNENLTFSNVPDPSPELPFKTYDISAQVGGPINKDKLWFFTGFEYPFTQTQPFAYPHLITDTYTKFITKLTYKWNDNNNLQGFAHYNNRYIENANADRIVSPEALFSYKNHQASWNATWISLWTPNTTLETRIGGIYDHQIPIEDHPDVPGHYDCCNGGYQYYGNNIRRTDDERLRFQANATLSHHAQNFIHGSHDFRFGVEFERSHAFTEVRFNGNMYYIDNNYAPYVRWLDDGYDIAGTNHRLSTFAQDEWNLNSHLSISAGVRWDSNRGYTDRGAVYSNDPVAPRIGMIWRVDRKNETVLKIHYGRYYDSLIDRNYFFLTDNPDTQYAQRYENGQWIDDRTFVLNSTISPPLKQPYIRQLNFGIDRVLPGRIPLSIHYIHRRWENILEDKLQWVWCPHHSFVSPITGQTIEMVIVCEITGDGFEYANHPELYRRYNGIELFASKQFQNHLSISASLVYSALSGNYPGSGDGRANTSFLDFPDSLINYPGKLSTDRPLLWKIVGTYPLPWGFNGGWYVRHQSGRTWAARGVDLTLPRQPRIYLEPAGSRSFPSQNLIDLRFEKAFSIFRGSAVRATVDVFNLLNSTYITAVNDFYGYYTGDGFQDSGEFGDIYGYNPARTIQLGVRYTF